MTQLMFVMALVGWIAVPLMAPFLTRLSRRMREDPLRSLLMPLGGAAAVGVLIVWIGSSLVWPWIDHAGDWEAVQLVYERWQPLNVGMVALTASAVAFFAANIRLLSEERRKAFAAQAFVPEALAALLDYLTGCAAYLTDACERSARQHNVELSGPLRLPTSWPRSSEASTEPPIMPEVHRAIFAENFRYAPEAVIQQLKLVLIDLQAHEAVVKELPKGMETNPGALHYLLITNALVRLAIIGVRLDRLYAYGLPGGTFTTLPIEADDLRNRLLEFGVNAFHVPSLDLQYSRWVEYANRKAPDRPAKPHDE